VQCSGTASWAGAIVIRFGFGWRDSVRVGVFAAYVAHYRIGVYRALNSRRGATATVCAPAKGVPGSSLAFEPAEHGFPFRDTLTLRIKVPLSGYLLTFQPYAVWAMVAGRFDIFLMAGDPLRLCVWMNLLLGWLLGRPVCLWGHGMPRRRTRLRTLLRRIMLRLATAAVFYTDSERDAWVARGLPARKLFVAYNATDTGRQEEARRRITAADLVRFQRAKGLEGRKVVLFVGRLDERKSPDVLVQAMRSVCDEIPEARAVIIGEGPMYDRLQDLVRSLRLGEAVALEGPVYDEETLALLFRTSAVGVMPTAAGLFVLHAFGYGLPVIIGDEDGSHGPEGDLVVDGVTGLRCRGGDADDLALAICRLLVSDAERAEMSARCQRLVEEKYNTEHMAMGIWKALEYCAGKGCDGSKDAGEGGAVSQAPLAGSESTEKAALQEGEYVFPYHYLDLLPRYAHIDMLGRSYRGMVKRIIGPFRGQRVLDACCGDGRFCYMLQGEDVQLVGVDRSEAAIRFARAFCPDVEFVVSDLRDFRPRAPFDVIVLIEALEHFGPEEGETALANLAKCLQKRGMLVVTAPSVRAPLIAKHYRHFTAESLRRTLSPYFTVTQLHGHLRVGTSLRLFKLLSKVGNLIDPVNAKWGAFSVYFRFLQGLLRSIEECPPGDALRLVAVCHKSQGALKSGQRTG